MSLASLRRLAWLQRRLYSVPKKPSDGIVPEAKKQPSSVPQNSAGLPSLDPNLTSLFKSPKVDYDPTTLAKATHYEFEAPKSPAQAHKDHMLARARGKTKFQKMLPSIVLSVGACWAIFAYKYYTSDMNPDVDTDTALLKPDKFLPYLVSYKYQIDDDHFLIELTRRNRSEKLINNQQLFSGDRMWSVEVMQPDINIVRSYTPLPMYVAGIDPYKQTPHLRLVSELEHEGKFVLIVKRYSDGEFSRWLTNLNLLDVVNLRGPIEDYKFPFHPLDNYEERPQMCNNLKDVKPDPLWPTNVPKPENYVFFGAGTGILPLFQLIYSPNPPKGFIDVWYSMKSDSELLPQLKTLNFFTEQCGRVKFHYLVGDRRLQLEDTVEPTLPNFTGGSDLRISEEIYKEKLKREKKLEIQRQLKGESKQQSQNDNIQAKQLIIEDVGGIDTIPLTNTKIKPESAYQQSILKRLFNLAERKSEIPTLLPSMAFVCGPENYISFVSGKPDKNNLEGEDRGPVGGLLKSKGWSGSNVKRLD